MKKMIAWMLALVTLLGVLSGCGAQTANPTETTQQPTETANPILTTGTLYVAFGAALEITYDQSNGNALTLIGTNEAGKVLAEAKQDQLNKGCVYTLRSILRYAITEGLLRDAKTVTIRIGPEERLPSDDFLEVIAQDCQLLIDEELAGLDMVVLNWDRFDDMGDLTYEAAAELAAKYLEVEAAEITGEEVAVNGTFTFTAGDRSCTVDAFTGLVVGK